MVFSTQARDKSFRAVVEPKSRIAPNGDVQTPYPV